jgi:hypothetical protein
MHHTHARLAGARVTDADELSNIVPWLGHGGRSIVYCCPTVIAMMQFQGVECYQDESAIGGEDLPG